jgi:hypothetical protein
MGGFGTDVYFLRKRRLTSSPCCVCVLVPVPFVRVQLWQPVSLYGDYLMGCDFVQSVIVWRMHEHGEVGATLVTSLSSEIIGGVRSCL